MWIENQVRRIWNRIGRSEKTALLATFVAGMLAHLFIWTNVIPNFDGMSRVYDEQQMTLVGRWFLHYASWLHDYTQMPMVIGVLGMFFLSMATFLVVRLFDIRSSLFAGIWGVLCAVFPVVAYTNAYTFTAAEYYLAALLATGAVYLVRKHGVWGWCVGCMLLALAMGIYQAYVCVAITISVLLIICDMLKEQVSFAKAVKNGFVHVFFIGAGTIVYYIVLQVFLKIKDLTLISYLNMDQVADGYPLELLLSTLSNTYEQVKDFFFVAEINNSFADNVMVLIHIGVLVLAILLLIVCIGKRNNKQGVFCVTGVVLLLLCLPAAMNFVQVMSPYSTPTPTMKYAHIFFYFLPILLFEMCERKKSAVLKDLKYKVAELLLMFGLLASIFYYWKYDNILYNMLNQAHRATESFVTNVVSRIESCEGYEYGMEVVIVGGFPSDRYYAQVENYDRVQQGGATAASVIPLNKHIYYYMNDWLNVPIAEPEEEVFWAVTATQEFQQMPLYPDDGSVKIIDGCVVVKMQESFTPKAQYEKDYENRR